MAAISRYYAEQLMKLKFGGTMKRRRREKIRAAGKLTYVSVEGVHYSAINRGRTAGFWLIKIMYHGWRPCVYVREQDLLLAGRRC